MRIMTHLLYEIKMAFVLFSLACLEPLPPHAPQDEV